LETIEFKDGTGAVPKAPRVIIENLLGQVSTCFRRFFISILKEYRAVAHYKEY